LGFPNRVLRAPVFCRLWRVNPPEAGKSEPPAVRVVVDSARVVNRIQIKRRLPTNLGNFSWLC